MLDCVIDVSHPHDFANRGFTVKFIHCKIHSEREETLRKEIINSMEIFAVEILSLSGSRFFV